MDAQVDRALETPRARGKLETVVTACGMYYVGSGVRVQVENGVNFNALLPTDLDHIDKISTPLDHCVEVKVYK